MKLWRSNGTAAGTILFKDILPGSVGSDPCALTNVNRVLYFVADDGVHGAELWRFDTTMIRRVKGGLRKISDVNGKGAKEGGS